MKPRNHWTFSDWLKNDPIGLNEMKESEPKKYKSLHSQQFKHGFKHTLEEMKNWSYNDYLAKDSKALQWIKDNMPEKYKMLYKQEFVDK